MSVTKRYLIVPVDRAAWATFNPIDIFWMTREELIAYAKERCSLVDVFSESDDNDVAEAVARRGYALLRVVDPA